MAGASLDWGLPLASLYPPAAGTVVAGVCAACGAALTGRARIERYLIPLSGALLILAAAGVLLPELASSMGWPLALALAALGYGILTAIDRLAFSVCPSCDHHDHSGRLAVELEGFAAPLLIAVAIHAFVDGWGLVAVHSATPGAVRSITLAILLHKIPEGLTLGAMTRASVPGFLPALLLCLAAELSTLLGGSAGLWLTPADWANYPLALATGTFLFLGTGALGVRFGRAPKEGSK